MFACREHWYRLPQEFRDAIWREYRPGQERDKRPSERYLAVQCAARAMLASDRAEFERLAADALVWRMAAFWSRSGDPFALLPAEWRALEMLTLEQMDDASERRRIVAERIRAFAERLEGAQ